ncbi:MAG: RNA polymerase sigma factor [Gemmatimonadota bacterium]|jgi:RNA polymerase sigma-70 factor (ECF subfamily)|nr:MAG: RNA polymerase sigma factor [Gemmatimonadota bacterium]
MPEPDPASAAVAIPRLLDEHGDDIYRLGLQVCGDPQGAEDLVQETFLKAYRGWDRFEGRSKPSTWLYTIALRTCQRMKRKRAGEPRHLESLSELLPTADEGILRAVDETDPLEALEREGVRASVQEAIGELPHSFRVPLVLKEMADLSVPEIAEITGLTEGTIKTRLYRARLKLRRALASSLPARSGPRPDHVRSECLDLLKAKQDALDRGVPFPVPRDAVCERCRSLFLSLDLAHEVCHRIAEGELPPAIRAEIRRRFADPPAPR